MSTLSIELKSPVHHVRSRIEGLSVPDVRILWVLLGLTLVRGVIYALLNPPFGSPDERDHFQYVAHLATGGASGPRGTEGNQPVPYYAMMVPAYWLTAGESAAVQNLAVRLLSVLLMMGPVLFAWLAARKLAPGNAAIAVLAASLVAFHPQFAYIGASANNDSVANFMAALLIYLTVSVLTTPGRWTFPIAVVVSGAALMTKGQILPVLCVFLLVLVGCSVWRLRKARSWKLLIFALTGTLFAGFALSSREGMILLDRAFSSFHLLKDGWVDAVGVVGRGGLESPSYQFASFWAAFLGEALRPATWWYALPATVTVLAPLGYYWHLKGKRERGLRIEWLRAMPWLVLAFMLAVQWLATYAYYLRVSIGPEHAWVLQALQGRYLFPVQVALALLVARGWSHLIERYCWPHGALGVVSTLVAFDVASLMALTGFYCWPAGESW